MENTKNKIKTPKLQAGYSKHINEYVLHIKRGSKEKVLSPKSIDDVEKTAFKQTGVEINYNPNTGAFDIPLKNRPEF